MHIGPNAYRDAIMCDMTDHAADAQALGQRIREGREELGYSIRKAAKEAGFSEGTWRHIESGYPIKGGGIKWRAITLDTLNRIAHVLDVHPDVLQKIAGDNIVADKRGATPGAAASRWIDASDLSDEDFSRLVELADRLRQKGD